MNEYTEGQVQQLLAEDPRVAEQGLRAIRVDDGIVLVGEVESPDRCAQIEAVLHEAFPGLQVRCDVGITKVGAPREVEQL